MKNKDLQEVLKGFPDDFEIIIHRDVESYGYGFIGRVCPGVFELTDYGNDFVPFQGILTSGDQTRALCLFAELEPEETAVVLPVEEGDL